MDYRATERLTFESLFETIEDDEFAYVDLNTIDLAFIPDPNIDDSEDEMGNQIFTII